MHKLKLIVILLFLSFLSSWNYAYSQDIVKCWIIFQDKGVYKSDMNLKFGTDNYIYGKSLISERAYNRRSKIFDKDNIIKFSDFPVNDKYINEISKAGISFIAKSKWLNGVSAYLTDAQIDMIKNLPFVKKIFAVKKIYKQSFSENTDVINTYPILPAILDTINRFNYGKSYNQMKLVNVPIVHNLGIYGTNVMIADLDDGFAWKTHPALKDLNILDEYDFINDDKNTSPEENQRYPDSKNQGGHGTGTLSSACGFLEGELVSPAFKSDIILAKTEYVSSETPMEEDFWLMAAEWAEAYGADIITSSLIYKGFDKEYSRNSYTYDDYDGNTAIITIAGDMAAHLGVVVCNAVGNYYQTNPPSLGSAADGDSVLSVGAIDPNGKLTSFSSNGPTKDGRMKPDVTAPGQNVYLARLTGGFEFASGTSFATPITAGVCALILSAHPELTPMQVINALKYTASMNTNPDNNNGYGIINAYDAMVYYGPVWSNYPEVLSINNRTTIKIGFAGNILSVPEINLYYKLPGWDDYKKINMKNEKIFLENFAGLFSIELPAEDSKPELQYYFTASYDDKEIRYPQNPDGFLK